MKVKVRIYLYSNQYSLFFYFSLLLFICIENFYFLPGRNWVLTAAPLYLDFTYNMKITFHNIIVKVK